LHRFPRVCFLSSSCLPLLKAAFFTCDWWSGKLHRTEHWPQQWHMSSELFRATYGGACDQWTVSVGFRLITNGWVRADMWARNKSYETGFWISCPKILAAGVSFFTSADGEKPRGVLKVFQCLTKCWHTCNTRHYSSPKDVAKQILGVLHALAWAKNTLWGPSDNLHDQVPWNILLRNNGFWSH
jgi:hypothetical protein